MADVIAINSEKKMSGNLYQLRTKAMPGQHVIINGPHDKYGKVMAHKESGFHLIRGVGNTRPNGTIHPAEVNN